jgi:FMN phosphatase YigB (HAD superfamily)
VIAFHVTNRYLNLVPVVEAIATALGMHATWINDAGADPLGNSSSWVLIAKDPDALNRPRIVEAASPIDVRRDWRMWTDDFNNLLQVLK